MPLAVFPKCFLDRLCVTGEMSVDDWLDLGETLDVDGYEFYWGFTPWRHPAELERIRRRVEDGGRSIPMMCFSPDFTQPSPAARDGEIARQKEAIVATARLGGRYCRVLSGQRRPEVSREAGLRWVAECIRAVLPEAETHGVTLILENHYKDGYWSHPEFAQKADVFHELVDAIGDHPNFGINFDPSNALVAGDDPIALLEAVKDRVVTIHASDRYLEGGTLDDLRRLEFEPQTGYAGILKHGVIGRGLNDYDRLFRILQHAGFAGWISIEDGQDPAVGMDHLRESAAFLRKKMAAFGLR
jgi:sugar phosphate isomerase/epimerase